MIAAPHPGVKTPTRISWEEMKADPGFWSTQFRRRSAIAFAVALDRNKVPGTPAGCRIVRSEEYGAEIVEPDGTRHPVAGRWSVARIMEWWESQFTGDDRRELNRSWDVRVMQVNRKWADEVAEWLTSLAWTVPEIVSAGG